MMVFAENLRSRAFELGLSNAEVARRAGLAERRYANYVIGRREPDLSTLLKIAEILGSSVDDLLRPREPSHKPNAVRDRLLAAIAVMDERDLEIFAVQAEAVVQSSPNRRRD